MSPARVPRFGQALSDREAQVLALTSEGLSNPAIGERLGLSHQTVKTHLFRISKKLGANGRVDAVRKADAAGRMPSAVSARLAVEDAALSVLEQLADGRSWASVRREALAVLVAAGRRTSGGRRLVPARDRRVAS